MLLHYLRVDTAIAVGGAARGGRLMSKVVGGRDRWWN